MMKKFLSSLLALFLFVGIGYAQPAATAVKKAEDAKEMVSNQPAPSMEAVTPKTIDDEAKELVKMIAGERDLSSDQRKKIHEIVLNTLTKTKEIPADGAGSQVESQMDMYKKMNDEINSILIE